MSAFIKTFGRWGGILTVILLLVTLLRQLIALVSFLLVAIKVLVVVAFIGLMLLIVFTMLRGRARRRRDLEDI
ncbi:MAG: hypothetical protein ABR577_19925 [Pyrinomonadaceae bacterium]